MFRLTRRFFRPLSRPAALLLAWQHRKTLAMWARSVRDEIDHARAAGRPELARWKALVPAMWQQRDAAERGTVDSLRVTPDHRVVPRRETEGASSAGGVIVVDEAFAGVAVPADAGTRVIIG